MSAMAKIIVSAMVVGATAQLSRSTDAQKADKAHVISKIKGQYTDIQYAHANLKNDIDVVLAALQTGWDAGDLDLTPIQHAGDALKNDEVLMSYVVSKSPYMLRHGGPEVKGNEYILRMAMARDPYMVRHASDELKKNAEFMIDAIAQISTNVQKADDSLKRLESVMVPAVTKNVFMVQHAAANLKADEGFMTIATDRNPLMAQHAGANLKDKKSYMLPLVQRCWTNYRHCSEGLQLDAEIIAAKDAGEMFAENTPPQEVEEEGTDEEKKARLDAKVQGLYKLAMEQALSKIDARDLEFWHVDLAKDAGVEIELQDVDAKYKHHIDEEMGHADEQQNLIDEPQVSFINTKQEKNNEHSLSYQDSVNSSELRDMLEDW